MEILEFALDVGPDLGEKVMELWEGINEDEVKEIEEEVRSKLQGAENSKEAAEKVTEAMAGMLGFYNLAEDLVQDGDYVQGADGEGGQDQPSNLFRLMEGLSSFEEIQDAKDYWNWGNFALLGFGKQARNVTFTLLSKTKMTNTVTNWPVFGGFNLANTAAVAGLVAADPSWVLMAGGYIAMIHANRKKSVQSLFNVLYEHSHDNFLYSTHHDKVVKIHFKIFKRMLYRWLNKGWSLIKLESNDTMPESQFKELSFVLVDS